MKLFGSILIIALAAVWAAAESGPRSPADDGPVIKADRVRITNHLQRVERALRRADVSYLNPEQQARRREALDHLRDYRLAGVFPHNHDFPGERVPYFADEHGTLCAMAYLVAESGRPDIVDIVRDRFNNGRVVELAADPVIGPVLAAWLEKNGMTVAEAQAVQPQYGPPTNPRPDCNADACIVTEYAVASALTGAAELATIGLNAGWFGSRGSRSWSGPAGVVLGACGMTLGAINLDRSDEAFALGVINMAAGAVTTALGLTAWLNTSTGSNGAAGGTEEPRVQPTLGATWDGRRQLGLHVRF
jgi:hypothetical protein